MGVCGKLMFIGTIVIGVMIGWVLYSLDYTSLPLPDLEDVYWGPGQPKKDDTTIKPYKINISEEDLQDLKVRLKGWRQGPDSLEGVAFQYGFHKSQLQEVVTYWRDTYNWRKRETLLNSLPQYTTQISGLNIHFLHVKPDPKKVAKGAEVVPLLLLHGWPGSVKEFYELIPRLVAPRSSENFVFEVIAPSLPGYGWSQGASKQGMGPQQVGLIMHKLMQRLNFQKYYIQGGDWGSVIGAGMAIYFPQNVLGYHTNMCVHGSRLTQLKMYMTFMFPSILASEEPQDKMANQFSKLIEETGYMHIQATKPDTIGAALTDSPVGLAVYILEKFSTWTNNAWKNKPDGGLSNYNKDDLLDNIMIYWFSKSITTSVRLYSEALNKKQMEIGLNHNYPIMVPTGCARFPQELLFVPKRIIEAGYSKLIRFSDMPKGGHFAAFEVPDLLSEDVWQFTAKAREYYKEENAKAEKKRQDEEKAKAEKMKKEEEMKKKHQASQ